MTGSARYFECTPQAHYQGGDHGLFLGEVEPFDYRNGDAAGFLSGQFTSIPRSAAGHQAILQQTLPHQPATTADKE